MTNHMPWFLPILLAGLLALPAAPGGAAAPNTKRGVPSRMAPSSVRFIRCEVVPSRVRPGQPARLVIEAPFEKARGVELRIPYCVARPNVPPTLSYDEKTRTAWLMQNGKPLVTDNGPLDRDPRPGHLTLELETRGVPPGLVFLTARLLAEAQKLPDTRDLGFTIVSPRDRLDVRISAPWLLGQGAACGRFTRTKDGTLILDGRISTDGGRTWTCPASGGINGGCPELSDGRILFTGYESKPIAGRPGWYETSQQITRDAGRTIQTRRVEFHVPLAKAAQGHGPHQGPLFTSELVETPKGRLVGLMMGWFKGDDAICPYGRNRPYSRTYVCESTNGGQTWEYLSTIGYDRIGSEGYNEGAIAILPGGDLGVVMRTGNMTDVHEQDNPVMFATSHDGGRTWSKPRRTGINGAYPDLKALSDGTLAVSAGRPGVYVTFSRDGGRTWSDVTLVDCSPFAGYTSLVETAPGEILMAFNEGYPHPQPERNVIRLARIHYAPRKK